MPIFELIVMSVGFTVVLAGGYLGYEGYQTRKRNQTIKRAEPVPPGQVNSGPVAVEGKVVADDTIPIGDEKLVAIESEIYQYGAGVESEFIEDGEVNAKPFSISKMRKSVAVDSNAVSVDASPSNTVEETVSVDDPPNGIVKDYFRWNYLNPQPEDAKRDYTLEWIAPGDEVTVYGNAKTEDGSTILTDEGSFPLFVTDMDPQELLKSRKYSFAKSAVYGLLMALAGVGIIGFGVIALFI